MKRNVLCLLMLCVLSSSANAQSLVDQIKIFDITKAMNCVVAGKAVRLTAITSQAKTIDEWSCILVGNVNRAAVVKFLGKPSQAFSGTLHYGGRVSDPDTGDLHMLQVTFRQGEAMPATGASFFSGNTDEASPKFVSS